MSESSGRLPICGLHAPLSRWLTLGATLLALSWWVVYTGYVDLHKLDLLFNRPYREISLQQYRNALAGTQAFPTQWRILGFWLVRVLEIGTGLDPHVIDAGLKTLALTASASLLFVFSSTLVGPPGAFLATTLYLLVTAAAFASEGYSIYFTNDHVMLVGWFAAVCAARQRRWPIVAVAVFVTAWAKETVALALVLVAIEAWRGRASWSACGLCALAFAVPTVILRTLYPAPFSIWAWWGDNLQKNLPFYAPGSAAMATALWNDLKVLLFLHVLWLMAARAWWRTADGFVRSLGVALTFYLAAGWFAFTFRELRHFLPVTILVLPLAVGEIERLFAIRSQPTIT